jgi:selenocysteine lyase/cysteine desulfurase
MDRQTAEAYRKDFLVTGKYIYLDHAGVAPLSDMARKAVEKFLREASEGGAFHYLEWMKRVLEARKTCARLINAEADEIAFVKNTSHGIALVAEAFEWRPGDNVIVYEREFPANLYPWLHLRRKGADVRFIPARKGRILLEDIEALIDKNSRVLSISSVQFTNGFRADLRRLGELCRKKKVLFCVDAIQSLGAVPMDVKDFGIDFLSADAHKWLLGPEGIGILYCSRAVVGSVIPAIVGWKSVERETDFEKPEFILKKNAQKFEEGSLNLMGVFGLAAAARFLLGIGIPEIEQRLLGLGDVIIGQAEQRGYAVLTPKEREERAGIVTFSGAFDPETVRTALRKEGIMVNVRSGGLRVSPHFYNTEDEVMKLFETMDRL